MALAMRCNCQMSFSSSFERPRFKLRSHRKRMDNTTRIGRPMASVTSMTAKSSESRGVKDWVNGDSKKQASGGRIQQRGSGDKRIDLGPSRETFTAIPRILPLALVRSRGELAVVPVSRATGPAEFD